MHVRCWNATKVIASTLDDSSAFESSENKTPDNVNYNDCEGVELKKVFIKDGKEIQSDDYDFSKNVLVYTRSNYSQAEYIINPDNYSDYTITLLVPNYSNAAISIEKKSKALFSSYVSVDAELAINFDGDLKCIMTTVPFEKGFTYNIKVTGIDESRINDTYILSIKQDNWVYAPNGGIFYNPKFTSKSWWDSSGLDYIDYTKIYLTDDILASLIEPWTSDDILNQRYNDINGKENYQMALHDHIPKLFYTTDEILGINSLSDADKANFIATLATYTGVVLLVFPKLSVTAGIVTLVGAESTTLAIIFDNLDDYKQFVSSLDEATFSPKFDYQLLFESCQVKNHIYNGFVNLNSTSNNWSTLNEYTNYINKYDEDIPGLRGYITTFNEKESICIDKNFTLT